jgi:thiol-disulfide isomerase/thioredoxin
MHAALAGENVNLRLYDQEASMKILSALVAILFLSLSPLAAQTPSGKVLSADMVMQRAADKLASVKRLGYKYTFEYNRPSQQRNQAETSQAYLDLAPKGGTADFKYEFSNENRLSVYNGSESFIADKESGKLFVENNPSFKRDGLIVLMNSPLTLKYALPRLIANKTIQKKLSAIKLDGRDDYLIEFSLRKAALNIIGDIFEIRPDQSTIYRVAIDKKTYLPVQVLQTNDKNDESVKTSFTDVTEDPAQPNALSWYFSTYQHDYKLETRTPLTLIQAGQTAPNFILARYANDGQISLEQHNGEVVLLEFWITYCGFCIAAVPKLNGIAEKFRDKGLHLISINMHDPASTIEFFRKNNKPEYTILTGGESLANTYGVEAYPAFVLINKAGKVVYSSSGLEEKALESAIMANLQE